MRSMQCHACGRAVTADDRFCGGCGASLEGVTDATESMPAIADDTPETGDVVDEPAWGDDPVWAATGELAETPADTTGSITDALPATEPITEVWSEVAPTGEHIVPPEPPLSEPITAPQEPVAASTEQMPAVPSMPAPIRETAQFRPGVVSALAVLTAIVTMVASFATIVAVSSSQRIIPTADTPAAFRTGTWVADDLAGNLSIGALVAVIAMISGGVAAAFGWRSGSGLAGGAGLAIAGIAALTIGLAQVPIDAAYDMAAIPTDNEFTLTITRDLGYWLQIVAGALGVIVFFASINDAFADRRAGLNPWIAAVGALATLVLAGGPLLPEGLGVFSDNWYVNEAPGTAPAMLLTGRLIQLALIALAGVLGFLSVRRWGLGVAIGGTLPATWFVLSTMFELVDGPVGPGYLNPGATDLHVHGVTIIGASAVLAFAVLAVVAAYDQARHEW